MSAIFEPVDQWVNNQEETMCKGSVSFHSEVKQNTSLIIDEIR